MAEGDFGYDEALPESIREIFQHLCQDLATLTDHWKFHKEIFDKQEHVDTINNMVLRAFQIIDECVIDSLILAFGRMADKSTTFNRDNCSLAALVERCPEVSGVDKLVTEFWGYGGTYNALPEQEGRS